MWKSLFLGSIWFSMLLKVRLRKVSLHHPSVLIYIYNFPWFHLPVIPFACDSGCLWFRLPVIPFACDSVCLWFRLFVRALIILLYLCVLAFFNYSVMFNYSIERVMLHDSLLATHKRVNMFYCFIQPCIASAFY